MPYLPGRAGWVAPPASLAVTSPCLSFSKNTHCSCFERGIDVAAPWFAPRLASPAASRRELGGRVLAVGRPPRGGAGAMRWLSGCRWALRMCPTCTWPFTACWF